jgi:hypothetical protein
MYATDDKTCDKWFDRRVLWTYTLFPDTSKRVRVRLNSSAEASSESPLSRMAFLLRMSVRKEALVFKQDASQNAP